MLEEIWQMHPQIANHRHAEAHKTITYQESRICLEVIELCNEQGIAVLPIHDSFIVKKQHIYKLEEIMDKAYELLRFMSVPKLTGGWKTLQSEAYEVENYCECLISKNNSEFYDFFQFHGVYAVEKVYFWYIVFKS